MLWLYDECGNASCRGHPAEPPPTVRWGNVCPLASSSWPPGVVAAALSVGLTAPGADAQPGPPPTSTNGNPVHLVASGLKTPTSFAFGGGSIFEGDGGNSEGQTAQRRYLRAQGRHGDDGSPALRSSSPDSRGTRARCTRAAVTSRRRVSSGGSASGWVGTVRRSSPTRRSTSAPKGFDGFNGIGFGANGRLYVGVDVGLTDGNDHGPRNTSPFVYDILSMQPNGKDLKVFATGMRQPWQMAFPAELQRPVRHRPRPGAGAKNPPDFVLRVRAARTTASRSATTPPREVRRLCQAVPEVRSAHRPDGHRLHGQPLPQLVPWAAGQGSRWRGLHARSGGPLKPLLKGFVAPTVGLGIGDHLFVGELTGQVFRVKI